MNRAQAAGSSLARGPTLTRARASALALAALALAALAAGPARAQDELRGWVFDPDGLRRPGVVVHLLAAPECADTTDADGGYYLSVPSPGTWVVDCRADGFAPQWAAIEIAGPSQRNFWLLPQVTEDFETGDLSSLPWQADGEIGWSVVADSPAAGQWCARSGPVENSASSTLQVWVQAAAPGEISFHLRVSSEAGYDGLSFAIDGLKLGFWSGEVGWQEVTYPVADGPHLLVWSWRKDEAVTVGQDAAWLDEIRFPGLAAVPVPQLSLDFGTLALQVQQGASASRVERIGNQGSVPLEFRIDFVPPDLGGGPDEAGTTWTDSDRPGGPAYQWVDLLGSGQVCAPAEDEAVWGPFDLGFAFPFYGAVHDQVWICANGFLSFGDTLGDYRNVSLPDTTRPNGLIAPFWDDLDPGADGLVLWRRDQAAQRFVVEWYNLPHFSWTGTGPPETFEAVLHADGRVYFQYATVSDPLGCSVGVENETGTVGLQVARDEPYLHAGLAVLVRPGPALGWMTAAPAAGTVPPGGSQLVTFTCDAESLDIGLHLGDAILWTDDPATPVLALPVQAQVVADLTGAAPAALPAARLLAPRPNPGNARIVLSFRLPAAQRVALRLYDAAGRLVRTLVDGPLPEGRHDFTWDGRDERGRTAASGTYLAQLSWEGGRQARRLMLLR